MSMEHWCTSIIITETLVYVYYYIDTAILVYVSYVYST
jgi:hypothetical protein